MKAYTYHADYLKKACELSEKKAERLMSRMSIDLYTRLLQGGYTQPEIMAVQLQIEDEQLHEWRERVAQVRQQDQVWLAQQPSLANLASVN